MKRGILTVLVALTVAGCTMTTTSPTTPPTSMPSSDAVPSPSVNTSEAATTPSEPVSDLGCQDADLSNLRIRPDQDGPLTSAYGSKIVKSAAVNTGDGFTVVAVLLAKPTGPDGADRVAWLMREGDGTGWVVEVSPFWDGSGGPEEHKVISSGPAARTAAVACLG